MDIKPPGTLEISLDQIELMNFLISEPDEQLFIVTSLGNQRKQSKIFSTESRKFNYNEKVSFTKTLEEVLKIECMKEEKGVTKSIGKIIIPIQPIYSKKKFKVSVFLIGNKGKVMKITTEMKFSADDAFFEACLILKNFGFLKKFSSITK